MNHQKVIKISIEELSLFYKENQVLKNVSLEVYEKEILGVIGPSNAGKSSLLRALNRLYEIDYGRISGKMRLDGENIFNIPINDLRKRVGLIFATPVVLPGSIFKNMSYGPKLHRKIKKKELNDIVADALKAANLWEEVKDRLYDSASTLSGGQQQRLCIARTLAMNPEVIMMDEPCSGLDPISTAKIEATMLELKETYTFILVTNNTKQAARTVDRTAFFLAGELIEINKTEKIFTKPDDPRTDDYIRGRFG
ncbi:MAG: phosphate ABC transporter ATP-binding protein [bacterium]